MRVADDRQHQWPVHHRRRRLALEVLPSPAGELVDQLAVQGHFHLGRLGKNPGETVRRRHRPATHRQRKRHRRVVPAPMGGDFLDDLVVGVEAPDVGTIAGAEIQPQLERPSSAKVGNHGDTHQRQEARCRKKRGQAAHGSSLRCGSFERAPRGGSRCRSAHRPLPGRSQ